MGAPEREDEFFLLEELEEAVHRQAMLASQIKE